jgi:hypothetical protein
MLLERRLVKLLEKQPEEQQPNPLQSPKPRPPRSLQLVLAKPR